MTASGKGLHGLSILGIVFMLTACTFIAVRQHGVRIAFLELGVLWLCAGIMNSRKAASPDTTADRTPTDSEQQSDTGNR